MDDDGAAEDVGRSREQPKQTAEQDGMHEGESG
jgi:hypothetical protein